MRWMWFVLSVGCFAVAFRTHSMGLAAVCLLAALAFLLLGTLALASSRIESRSRDESAMLGGDELRRLRDQMERRKQAEGAPVTAGDATRGRRDQPDPEAGPDGDGSD